MLFLESERLEGAVVAERDKGIADAFNKGTKQATGDYFCYLNAGDLFESSATVSNVAATIAETYAKDARLFAGDFICETDDGSFLTRTEVAPTAFRHTNPINHQSVIISRELALAYPYDRHLKLGMDYDLWLRLIRDEIPLTHLSIPIARYATDGISSNLNWAVHNLIERELLWHKHFTKRLAIHNLSLIVFRALTLKLSILARKLVGRSTIKFIKKTGLSRKIRFVRMQKNKGVDQNPQTSAN